MNRTGFPYFSLEQLLFIQTKIEKINFSLVNLNVNQLANCSKKSSYNYLMDVLIPEYLLFVVIDVLGLDIQDANEMSNPKFVWKFFFVSCIFFVFHVTLLLDNKL